MVPAEPQLPDFRVSLPLRLPGEGLGPSRRPQAYRTNTFGPSHSAGPGERKFNWRFAEYYDILAVGVTHLLAGLWSPASVPGDGGLLVRMRFPFLRPRPCKTLHTIFSSLAAPPVIMENST